MSDVVQTQVDAQVCYLLAMPCEDVKPTEAAPAVQRLRDAPYFDVLDVEVRTTGSDSIVHDGVPITIHYQIYDGVAQIAECYFSLPDVLSATSLQTKARIQAALRAHLTSAQPQRGDMVEEYVVLMISTISGTPDEFIDRNGQTLARFIRSQREVFGPREIDDILISRVRYSEADLTVVDWEGAVIISPEGDFQSDIELLKIGNYQLLRYRLLDEAIDQNLTAVSQNLQDGARRSLLPTRSKRVLRQVIEQRLSLTLGFEKINQSLLLIGDWYTAKLYRAIYEEYYLDEWEAAIQAKLENLESIIQVIQENFEFSWSRFLELVQIAGWLLLLLGYFVLFFLDLRAYQ